MPYTLRILHPDNSVTVKQFAKKPAYQDLRSAVGNLIEALPHFTKYDGKRVVEAAWVDEEGQIKGLPFNQHATDLWLENLGKGPFRYEPRVYGPLVIVTKD